MRAETNLTMGGFRGDIRPRTQFILVETMLRASVVNVSPSALLCSLDSRPNGSDVPVAPRMRVQPGLVFPIEGNGAEHREAEPVVLE